MDTIWIATILYGVLLFAIAGWVGRRRPGWYAWAWVDIPYYTLAALAVVMLFAADRNIRLEQFEARRQRLHQEWLANPNLPPDVMLQPTSPVLVLQSYQGLMIALDHGEACKRLGSLECSERVVIGDAVAAAFQGFVPREVSQPEQQAGLEEEFCERAYRLVDALDDSELLDANAYSLLKTALSRQSRERVPSSQGASRLRAEIRHAQQSLQAQLERGTSRDAATLMAVHGEFAVYLFHMSETCATRPSDQADAIRRLSAWRAEANRRSRENLRVSRAAELAAQKLERTRAQRFVKSLQESIWPFIILLALALKFGKSVADVTFKARQGQPGDRQSTHSH